MGLFCVFMIKFDRVFSDKSDGVIGFYLGLIVEKLETIKKENYKN